MSMSDPIADLLTRLRNAMRANHDTAEVPASRLKIEVCRVLKEEGFVADYVVTEEPAPGTIKVTLRYTPEREPVMQGLRRISKPSLRVQVGSKDIRPVRSGLGVSILTTSRGEMTGKRAKEERVGGEILCEVW